MGKGADVTAKLKAAVPSPELNFPLEAWLAAVMESSDDAIVSKTLEGHPIVRIWRSRVRPATARWSRHP
jgi:hypothetical protein